MKYSSLLGHTYDALHEFFLTGKPADAILDRFFRSKKYLGSRDRRFIAETAYGLLRNLRLSQELAGQIVGQQLADIDEEGKLRLAILVYDVVLAKRDDAEGGEREGFLKGVLSPDDIVKVVKGIRSYRAEKWEDRLSDPGVRHSFPDWMVERLNAEYGTADAERLFHSLNEPAPLTIRANLLKATREDCQQRLAAENVVSEPTGLSPLGLSIPKRLNIFGLAAFREGYFEVQDEGSQLLPLLIDPRPTAKVLDACAGAGGKTLELAMLMKNRGEILAADVHDRRLDELRKRSRRAGAHNIRTKVIDLLEDDLSAIDSVFDIVLVDAPCSGVGTIRRNPGMKWTVTESTVREVSEKQKRLLSNSSRFVKPGGLLVYATCTLFREENEDVVADFLSSVSNFELQDPAGRAERLQLNNCTSNGYVKLLPHIHGTDGFFGAFLRRCE